MQHSTLLQRAASSGLGQQRPLAPGRRLACAPVCAKKGKPAAKVNKRGKVSSRPGPGWQPAPEAMPQPVQQQQQQPAEQPQAAPAAAPQQQQQQQAAVAAPQQQQQQPRQQQQAAGARGGAGGVLAETPQVVVDRMFKRVITFAGLPVITGLLLFPVFYYLRVVQKVEYPIWVVYVTQAFMFGGGLLGISYGILSTSWDPRREGSALGWTELQANLPILLNRNKEQQ